MPRAFSTARRPWAASADVVYALSMSGSAQVLSNSGGAGGGPARQFEVDRRHTSDDGLHGPCTGHCHGINLERRALETASWRVRVPSLADALRR